ncbi:MAG: universal stress protein [Thermodesulfobacteriota bacterium]
MTHTIIWPTELSRASLKALPQINSLAEKFGSKVLALYVAADLCSLFPAYGNYPSPELIEKFQDYELEKAKKDLQNICSNELTSCPYVDFRIVRGEPVGKILEEVESEAADMIVMTSRGQTYDTVGKPGTNMGSVAWQVANQSPVTVVLINPETKI